MPAEWEPHEATWLSWPHEKTDWPGKFAPIPWVYAEIVRNLARVERVRILVRDAAAENDGQENFDESPARILRPWIFFACRRIADGFGILVRFLSVKKMANWPRHIGCSMRGRNTTTASGMRRRSRNLRRNEEVEDSVHQPMYSGKRVVLEGGGIEVNGRGTIMTTEEWLLSPMQVRNSGIYSFRLRTDFSRKFWRDTCAVAGTRNYRR